jgi:hypothetical protein
MFDDVLQSSTTAWAGSCRALGARQIDVVELAICRLLIVV